MDKEIDSGRDRGRMRPMLPPVQMRSSSPQRMLLLPCQWSTSWHFSNGYRDRSSRSVPVQPARSPPKTRLAANQRIVIDDGDQTEVSCGAVVVKSLRGDPARQVERRPARLPPIAPP